MSNIPKWVEESGAGDMTKLAEMRSNYENK